MGVAVCTPPPFFYVASLVVRFSQQSSRTRRAPIANWLTIAPFWQLVPRSPTPDGIACRRMHAARHPLGATSLPITGGPNPTGGSFGDHRPLVRCPELADAPTIQIHVGGDQSERSALRRALQNGRAHHDPPRRAPGAIRGQPRPSPPTRTAPFPAYRPRSDRARLPPPTGEFLSAAPDTQEETSQPYFSRAADQRS